MNSEGGGKGHVAVYRLGRWTAEVVDVSPEGETTSSLEEIAVWRLRTRQLPRGRAWCCAWRSGNKEIIYFGAGPFLELGLSLPFFFLVVES